MVAYGSLLVHLRIQFRKEINIQGLHLYSVSRGHTMSSIGIEIMFAQIGFEIG